LPKQQQFLEHTQNVVCSSQVQICIHSKAFQYLYSNSDLGTNLFYNDSCCSKKRKAKM